METLPNAAAFAQFFTSDASTEKILAGLYQKMEEGHVCLKLEGEPRLDRQIIGKAEEGAVKPFVVHNNHLYTQRFFYYETLIVEKLIALTQKAFVQLKESSVEHIKKAIQLKDDTRAEIILSEEEKPDWQLLAAVNACRKHLCIITGGPGTGKTTTLAKILSILQKDNPDLRIALAAPTGKAAGRMKESLINSSKNHEDLGITELTEKLKPQTIHRLLGTLYPSPFFKHNKSNPLPADVVIIDECSMIGASLFAKMLDAIGPETRLILLGDSNQLSPVESGSVFGDVCELAAENMNRFPKEEFDFLNTLCAKDKFMPEKYLLKNKNTYLDGHVIRLQKTWRYRNDSAIGQFTSGINRGDAGEVERYLDAQEKQLKIDESYDPGILDNFVTHYKNYIEEDDISKALEKFNKVRVLCAVRESAQGIYHLNEQIENKLKNLLKKERNPKYNPSKTDFYHHQPILITRNMNDLQLNNGDVGIIRLHENGRLMAFFPCTGEGDEYGKAEGKNYKVIHPGLITHWETVYAMTIHKSQGSEFEQLLVVLPKKQSNDMLTRELIYTAITRGKKEGKVIVQTNREVLLGAVQKRIERTSGVADRLKTKTAVK